MIVMKPKFPPKLDRTSVKTTYGAIDGSAQPATNQVYNRTLFSTMGNGFICDRTLTVYSQVAITTECPETHNFPFYVSIEAGRFYTNQVFACLIQLFVK